MVKKIAKFRDLPIVRKLRNQSNSGRGFDVIFRSARLQNASIPAEDIVLTSTQVLLCDIRDMKKRDQDGTYGSRPESSKKYREKRKTLQAQIEEDLSKMIEKVLVLEQERVQLLSMVAKQQVLYFPCHIVIYRKMTSIGSFGSKSTQKPSIY